MHWRAYALSLVVALVSVWIILSSEAFQECVNKSYYESADKEPEKGVSLFLSWIEWRKACTGTFLKENGEAITALFTIILAFSTIGLWLSTNRLWDAGERQLKVVQDNFARQLAENREIAETNWKQSSQSILTSIEATKAATSQAESASRQAKIAEDALIKIERPYVLVTRLGYIQPPSTSVLESGKIKIISGHHVTYQIGNFGRTAALLHEVRHVFQVESAKGVPDNPFSLKPPPRPILEGFDAGYALAAGEIEEDQYFTLPKHIDISDNGSPKLSSGKTIFMFVRVRYEDAAGGPVRDSVSTWKYDLSQHHFLKCGGKQHNYEIEVDPTS
jgi:hypothetical protein